METEGAPQRDKLQALIVRKERNLIDLVKRAQALGSDIEDYVPYQLGNAPESDLEDDVVEEGLSAGSGSGSGLGLPVFGAGAGIKSSSAPGSH